MKYLYLANKLEKTNNQNANTDINLCVKNGSENLTFVKLAQATHVKVLPHIRLWFCFTTS